MRTIVAAAGVALVLALCGRAPAVAADRAEPAPDELRAEAVALVNEARAVAGLPELEESALLRDIAAERAWEMAVTGRFAHARPGGGTVEDLLGAYGVPHTVLGENIARSDEAPDRVVFAVHRAQMASDGHRANLMAAEFSHVGVAVARAGGMYYFALIFTD